MKTLVYSANKGGDGKSTIALNVAGYLGLKSKVLFIGLDGQKNSSSVLNLNNTNHSIYEVLNESIDIKKAIHQSKFNNVWYIPETRKLDHINVDKITIKKILQSIYNQFDYVIIDCPPAINSAVKSAYVSADVVNIPLQLDKFSSSNLMTVIKTVHQLNNNVQINVLPNMVISNSKLHKHVKGELKQFIDTQDKVSLGNDLPHRIEISNLMFENKLLTLSNKFNKLKTAIKKHTDEVR